MWGDASDGLPSTPPPAVFPEHRFKAGIRAGKLAYWPGVSPSHDLTQWLVDTLTCLPLRGQHRPKE